MNLYMPESNSSGRILSISAADLLRATLAIASGNEGWIGVSPHGEAYHIVVPVDSQIARGVMACNRPTDGTPFGGYSGWLYFRCPPYEQESLDLAEDRREREDRARRTANSLTQWLAEHGVNATVEGEFSAAPSCAGQDALRALDHEGLEPGANVVRSGPKCAWDILRCKGCGMSWVRLSQFLRDAEVRLALFRACAEDFDKGVYVFRHGCGSMIEAPASFFIMPRAGGKSLAGAHACPGMCYYETSLAPCSARCHGAIYRRAAWKLSLLKKPALAKANFDREPGK
jgi:hypothetical protein